MVAGVFFQVWPNVETLLRAEFPGFAFFGLGMYENHAAKGANCSGIIIELAIERLPGRELRSVSRLEKEF